MNILLDENEERLMGQDDKGRTILHIAVSSRSNYSNQIVEELINRASKNEDTLKKLLNCQDKEGWTALHRAVLFNSLPSPGIIRILLKAGADWTIRDNHNDTALGIAKVRYEKGRYTYGTLIQTFKETIKLQKNEEEQKEEHSDITEIRKSQS